MQILNCKQKCSVELASTVGKDKPFEDFLPSHFNYLQFSYYNSESKSLFTERIRSICCLSVSDCACLSSHTSLFLSLSFSFSSFPPLSGEKYEQAIEWAKTYLLFHPEEEVMNQNLAYYSAVLGEDKAAAISARLVCERERAHTPV